MMVARHLCRIRVVHVWGRCHAVRSVRGHVLGWHSRRRKGRAGSGAFAWPRIWGKSIVAWRDGWSCEERPCWTQRGGRFDIVCFSRVPGYAIRPNFDFRGVAKMSLVEIFWRDVEGCKFGKRGWGGKPSCLHILNSVVRDDMLRDAVDIDRESL